jgi:hypothetical protein
VVRAISKTRLRLRISFQPAKDLEFKSPFGKGGFKEVIKIPLPPFPKRGIISDASPSG